MRRRKREKIQVCQSEGGVKPAFYINVFIQSIFFLIKEIITHAILRMLHHGTKKDFFI